ncbi:hypothetical protein D3C80_1514290 [compost metagenome]
MIRAYSIKPFLRAQDTASLFPGKCSGSDAVTLSIGATLFDQPPASLAALIEQGDAALYESKRGGRDSIRLVERTVASL